MKVKIEQIESDFAEKLDTPLKNTLQELQYAVPQNYQLCVSFLDANGRKKRSNASSDNWSPESGRIEIRFEPKSMDSKTNISDVSLSLPSPMLTNGGIEKTVNHVPAANTSVPAMEADLLRALDRAESTPGWSFVSLKKFRDEILPTESIPSTSAKLTDVHWQELIRSSIEKRFILVGKVANPKSPQFPVTTIRLNRLMPEVQVVLGGGKSDLDFHPINIKGEPLSTTILRERR